MSDPVMHGEILGPEDDEAREKRVRRGLWRTLRRAARHIPFSEDLVAGYFCAIDRTTPRRVRTTLFGALAYFVLPLDAIPDFLAGVGYGDDATILLGTLALVGAHIRPQHREAARKALSDSAVA